MAATESEPLEHSVGDRDLNLVHYGQPGMRFTDPSRFGKSGLTPRSELSGDNRSYFYVKGKENRKDPVLSRKDAYRATVNGGRIYDGDKDPLDYGAMANRWAADSMLKGHGYEGILRTGPGGYKQVEMFGRVPLSSASGGKFLPAVSSEPATAAEDARQHLSEFNGSEVKKAMAKPNWAVLTATQEAQGAHDSPANIAANQSLEDDLKNMGLPYAPVTGAYKGQDQGKSFLVTGISDGTARYLGKKYNQESVLTPKGFEYQDGSYNPLKAKSSFVGPKALEQPGYTVLPDGTPFSMDISPSRLPGRDQPGYAPLDQVKDQLVGKKGGQMAIGERYAGQANHPEAVPLRFETDKNGKVKLDKDGEPKIATQPYDFFSGPLIDSLGIHPDVLQSLKTSLNTTTLKQIKDGYLEKELSPEEKTALHKVTNAFAERAVKDFGKSAGSPEVRGAAGWYSDIADFFKKLIPDEGNRLKFLEFLGGTSPNTDVESNFLYALDLYNRFVRGDLEQHHAAEQYVHKNYDTLAGKYAEKKPVLLDSGAHATAKGVPQYSWELKPEMAKQWQKDHYDALISDGVKHSAALDRSKKFSQSALDNLLYLQNNVVPRRQGGGKYGVHTDRILQILDGVWRDATDAPKAPNFTENLAGVSTRATIDVWAARWLRRLAHEGLSDKAWRLLPMAEQGVGNADFFLGQHVFDEATRRINGQYSEQLGRPINPDDLQAIMWFAEKRLWKDKGWKQGEDLGDFRQYAHKLTPNPDGSFSLRNVTLNRSSPDFLGTLSHVGLENAVLMSERRSALKGALEGARAMKKLSDKGLETSTPMANASAKFLENLSKLGNVVNK